MRNSKDIANNRVIPAKAGTHSFKGVCKFTGSKFRSMGPGLRRDDATKNATPSGNQNSAMNLNFPLTLRFKLIALAPQVFLEDSRGQLLLYVKQKLLKLKEEVNVFSDEAQNKLAFTIKADRVIDFRARYTITNGAGQTLGAIKQRGMKSLWKAHFDVEDAFGRESFFIEEESPLVRMFDGLFGSIPIIGILSGYLFQPTYLVKRVSGGIVMKLKKQPALWEGRFELTEVAPTSDAERQLLALSVVMMTLLERDRG
jgi:uncharacterized protein YxjI